MICFFIGQFGFFIWCNKPPIFLMSVTIPNNTIKNDSFYDIFYVFTKVKTFDSRFYKMKGIS